MRILNAVLGAAVALAVAGALPAGAPELRVGLGHEPAAAGRAGRAGREQRSLGGRTGLTVR